jgi:hypothetical protein
MKRHHQFRCRFGCRRRPACSRAFWPHNRAIGPRTATSNRSSRMSIARGPVRGSAGRKIVAVLRGPGGELSRALLDDLQNNVKNLKDDSRRTMPPARKRKPSSGRAPIHAAQQVAGRLQFQGRSEWETLAAALAGWPVPIAAHSRCSRRARPPDQRWEVAKTADDPPGTPTSRKEEIDKERHWRLPCAGREEGRRRGDHRRRRQVARPTRPVSAEARLCLIASKGRELQLGSRRAPSARRARVGRPARPPR